MNQLPAIILPMEFVVLLKDPHAATTGIDSPFSRMLRQSRGLGLILERAFAEFNEHKIGLEKIFTGLGWANFRDRLASVYFYKALNGSFPLKTDMELVAEVQSFETRFRDKAIAGASRLYLLGTYLRFLNIYLSQREDGEHANLEVPASVDVLLNLTQVRSERPDWLILLCWHFDSFFGTENMIRMLREGATYQSLFGRLTPLQQQLLVTNLLAYGASIKETDPFLFERI